MLSVAPKARGFLVCCFPSRNYIVRDFRHRIQPETRARPRKSL